MNEYGEHQTPFIFLIDFEMQMPVVLKINEVDSKNIKFAFDRHSNIECYCREDKKLDFKSKKLDWKEYQNSFDKVMQNIVAGNSYLTNLTNKTEVETNFSFDEIFFKSKAKYRMNFYDKFVFFSPETFVKIERGKISSYPMKGTIEASIKNAEQTILNDKKETAEHNTIVDLIRNDLSIVAKNVKVERFRYVDKITTNNKTLLQVSSKIVGELPKGYEKELGDFIFKLLPAGSISGAPKKKTVEIIKEAEKSERGYYTGVAGYFDGRTLDSCVIIRYIEKQDDKLFYKSGGGITNFSDAKKEYDELNDKIYIPK